ncbi:MAG TPA: IMP dehydrogenase, partial [Candidatus Limnocylindrales bacterium]
MTSASAPTLADIVGRPDERGRRPSKVDSLRPTYSFDDVSLAPGVETIDPADVSLSGSIGEIGLKIPVLASAMDAVVDPAFAGALAR